MRKVRMFSPEDAVIAIGEFVDDLIEAVRKGIPEVEELSRNEHGLSVPTGYRCKYRGIDVIVGKAERHVLLDGISIGPEILDKSLQGTHSNRYSLLLSDMIERNVMQECDAEEERRSQNEKSEAEELTKGIKARSKAYNEILARLKPKKR